MGERLTLEQKVRSTDILAPFYPTPDVLMSRFERHQAKEEILIYLQESGASVERLFHWPERSAGLLSDIGILRHMLAGNIVIYPFHHQLLQPSSYDVRLGRHFYLHQDPQLPAEEGQTHAYYCEGTPFYNPHDPADVKRFWSGPLNPVKAEYILRKYGTSPEKVAQDEGIHFLRNIDGDEELIILLPLVTLLAHTEEFIGGRNIIGCKISGKSTVGRNMIEICSDANIGNVGFTSRWTLEITNKTHVSAISLVVGEPVAQIQFEELVEPPLRQYAGKYQEGQEINDIARTWTPEMMLPRWRRHKIH